MKVTVTTYLNRRINSPETLPDNKSGVLSPGDIVEVAEVLEGQEFEGVSLWLKDINGSFFWSGGTDYAKKIYYADRIVNLPEAWENAKGEGITVALLDSGITATHPLLQPILKKNIGLAKSFTTPDINDIRGHGTAMAGVVCGVAPACDVLVIKVLDDKGNTIPEALAGALDYMLELKPRIVNLSLGVTQKQYDTILYTGGETIKTKIDKLAKAGVLIVAAAGNDSDLTEKEIYYLAMNDNVVSVGASDSKFEAGTINKNVDFVFYNSVLQTTGIDGGVSATTQNTSAYTAMISGVAATLLSVETVQGGISVKDFVLARLNTIASAINSFSEPNNSEVIIYKIN